MPRVQTDAGQDRRGRTPRGAYRGLGYGSLQVSSTEAQNRFGHYLDQAAKDRSVVITRRDEPQAVLISIERYRALVGEPSPALERLRERFDRLFDRMQEPGFAAATRTIYSATSEEMGRAAVEAARRRAVSER